MSNYRCAVTGVRWHNSRYQYVQRQFFGVLSGFDGNVRFSIAGRPVDARHGVTGGLFQCLFYHVFRGYAQPLAHINFFDALSFQVAAWTIRRIAGKSWTAGR